MLKRLFLSLYALEQKTLGRFGIGRWPVIRTVKKWIFLALRPKFGEAWGMKFHLDAVHGLPDPATYKSGVARVIREELHEGETVVDVGANIGLFTCLMAKAVGPGGKVFAFEPEPANLELLEKNLQDNSIGNVVVIQKALSDKAGKLTLAARGAHTSFGLSDGAQEKTKVELTRLDDLAKLAGRKVSLVKMDITGYEAKALRGMKQTILRNKNIRLLSAFCPAYLKRVGDAPLDYLKNISGLGLKIFEINADRRLRIMREDFPAFIAKYSGGGKILQAEIFCAR